MVCTGKYTDGPEIEMLNEQKMQGFQYAKKVHVLLKAKGMERYFLLFTVVYHKGIAPQHFLSKL